MKVINQLMKLSRYEAKKRLNLDALSEQVGAGDLTTKKSKKFVSAKLRKNKTNSFGKSGADLLFMCQGSAGQV